MKRGISLAPPQLFFGLATPQANPTVEAEFRILFRGRLLPVTTRLVSRAQGPEERLRDYFDQISAAVESFDELPLSAFGFACTGSAYLVGRHAEDASVQRLMDHFGLPVVTATAAIRAELAIRKAKTLAILAPYPETLCRAAAAYWEESGLRITCLERLETGSADTRSIYALTGDRVIAALDRFDARGADAVLLSGTGMPTLEAILRRDGGPPLISSNVCLAAQLLRRTGEWPAEGIADAAAVMDVGRSA